MATEIAMAMRRLKAQEALAKEVADLNRKMDLVMAHLGIVTSPAEPADEVPAPGDANAKADESSSDPVVDTPPADEVPAADDGKNG